jgi:hypothetical protein
MKNKILLINHWKKELKRKDNQDILKICKKQLKDLKVILKDGCQNGKEKGIKRKGKKVLVKLKG